jgi:hypothetical protein
MHLTRLGHCTQYYFMALSTLSPPLPALEDLITLTPRPTRKKIGPQLTRDIRRDILLLRDLSDYDGDEAEYMYEHIADLLSRRLQLFKSMVPQGALTVGKFRPTVGKVQ